MNKTKIKIAIVFISFLQGLQFTISPVLTQLQNHYPNTSRNMIQMLITAPSLLSMIIAVICGRLVLKVSKKKLLLTASFIAGVAGFIPFLSDRFEMLFFARTFYGIGLGLAATLNTVVVAEHFEGKERVKVMGIQGASVGAGMLLITTLSGMFGAYGYQNTYYIHTLAFLCMLIIWRLLPDTGKEKETKTEKIKLNGKVFKLSVLMALELIFLITFTTNIAMHIGGNLEGNTSVSGMLIGVFSGVQIIVGLFLGYITKYTRKYTLPLAMLFFSIGSFILILSPSNLVVLFLGAVFCGMSQGIFIPQAMYEATVAVKPVATAMAAAALSVAMCVGQLISPVVLNSMSHLLFGNVTTTYVYGIAAVSMILIFMILMVNKMKEKN